MSGRRKLSVSSKTDWTDLCAVCDGVGLLSAEVRQDVCRFPLTGVMNSWTYCKEKPGQCSRTKSWLRQEKPPHSNIYKQPSFISLQRKTRTTIIYWLLLQSNDSGRSGRNLTFQWFKKSNHNSDSPALIKCGSQSFPISRIRNRERRRVESKKMYLRSSLYFTLELKRKHFSKGLLLHCCIQLLHKIFWMK